MSCAKLPCPVLFQRTVACTSMSEEHREAADRQKTDSTGQTDNRDKKKNRAWSLPSYGGCFTGCCLPWLLGSTHHLGGLCWLQHKTPARESDTERDRSTTHHRRAACKWEGHRDWPGWPRNVSHTILEHPAGQADGEKTLADAEREMSV